MNQSLIIARKYYFSFLFSTIIPLSVLIILYGKDVLPFEMGKFFLSVSLLTSIIPAFLFLYRWRRKSVDIDVFKKLCLIAFIPVLAGTLLSFFYKNYLYLVLLFPVSFLSYLVILPTERFIKEK